MLSCGRANAQRYLDLEKLEDIEQNYMIHVYPKEYVCRLYMYVCMYVCMYVYIYIYIYLCVCVCVFITVHIHVHPKLREAKAFLRGPFFFWQRSKTGPNLRSSKYCCDHMKAPIVFLHRSNTCHVPASVVMVGSAVS